MAHGSDNGRDAKSVILVVEDDSAIRPGPVDALQFAGYGVFECDNGRAAVELATVRLSDVCCLSCC